MHKCSSISIGVALMCLVAPTSASRADAQPHQPAPGDVEVGISISSTNPLHGDLDFSALGVLPDVRVAVVGPLAVDLDVGRWSHTTEVTQDSPPLPGLGRASRIVFSNAMTGWSIGISLLGQTHGRRASFFAGGGPGIYWEDRTSTVTFEDCESTSPAFSCGTISVERRSSARAGLQAIAGVDVHVGGRWKVFGAFRYEHRDLADAAGGALIGIGGVRFRLTR